MIVPETFARDTITREGDAGRQWIDRLPRIVADLCQQWQLAIDGAPMHGYLGVVVPVRRGGEACVLKVSWLDESNADEALALTTWNGEGAVRLLAVEPASGEGDYRFRYYNADGGEAEMCGNGARCFGRFAQRISGQAGDISFETQAGVITATPSPPEASIVPYRCDLVNGIKLAVKDTPLLPPVPQLVCR